MAAKSVVFLKESEIRAGEEAGFVTERIVRNGSLADEVRITYGVTSNTATDGQDFVGGTGTITMAAGVSEVSVQIRILGDAAAEGTEIFTFSLINAEGAGLSAPRTSRISILDDEAPSPPPPAEPPLKSDYAVNQKAFVRGLDVPIKFEFSPVDPSLVYVAEKGGVVKVADLDDGSTTTLLDLRSRVNDYGDRGLLDIALHPDFAKNPYIYVFAVMDPGGTAGLDGNAGPDGAGNRYAQVLRYTVDASTGYTTVKPGSELVLLGKAGRSLDDISGRGRDDFMNPAFAEAPSSERWINTAAPVKVVNGIKQDFIKVDSMTHAGGSLIFGPDGALYVGVGDGTSPNYPDPHSFDVQSLDSLSGKILRVDPLTGLGLADNPFADAGVALDTNKAKVWQVGVRNPFSTAFDGEGRLFISNTGWNLWEVIHQGGAGANFGWPFYEGRDGGVPQRAQYYEDLYEAGQFYAAVERGDISITAPFRAFSHDSADPGYQIQAITAGSAIYTGDIYPAAFKDDFFFADFTGGEVYTVDVKDRTQLKFLFQGPENGVPVEFVQGPDGHVYYADLGFGQPGLGEIGRLEIAPIEPPPPPPPPTYYGTEGEDRLAFREGDETIDGQGGRDWVDMLAEGRRGSAVSAQPDGKVAVAHGGENDALANVEEIRFADGRLAFDPADPAAKVLRLYEAALDRLPDQGGLNFWIDALQDGGPLALLAGSFLSSAEFVARFGGDTTGNGAFVDRLYLNVLGRPAEADGHAFWTAVLDQGVSRADVLAAFSESVENKAGTAALVRNGIWDRSEEAMEVARLYDTVFGRSPDAEGLTGWKDVLESGAASLRDVADAFTGSAEFRARYGALSDRDFADALYVNTLDRPADQAGLDHWTGVLNAGAARSAVVLAFSESAEHVALTANSIGGENPAEFGILFA